MKPIYSVVLVTYFHEKYVRKAIESILEQSEIDNIELLIGDDGSKDNTVNIIKEYEKKHNFIKVFTHENVGLSKNLYELLMLAKGDYIAILEGDDYWIDKNKLKKQREIIEKNNCVGTACNSLKINFQGEELGLWNEKIPRGLLTDKQIINFQTKICHPSGIMIKNVFQNSCGKYSVIRDASRMGGNHTGLINLMGSEGGLFLDTEPMTTWRFVQVDGGKNYSSQKYSKPIDHYENMKKYETYDSAFRLNYEDHIYREYYLLKKSLKKEFIGYVGIQRYYWAFIRFQFGRIINRLGLNIFKKA